MSLKSGFSQLQCYLYIGLGGGFNERGIVEYKRRDDSGALSLWLYTSHGAPLLHFILRL